MVDVIDVTAVVSIAEQVEKEVPKDFINRSLTHELARHLVSELDTLPITYSTKKDEVTRRTEHKMRFVLISDNELRRLRDIERLNYFTMVYKESEDK